MLDLNQLLAQFIKMNPTQPLFSELQPHCLLEFWERLKKVKRLTLHAKSHSKNETGWNGEGEGDVFVTEEGQSTLVFQESGHWNLPLNRTMAFSNVFRWTLDVKAERISLEHLRQGRNAPVFLFHLAPIARNLLASIDSHLCGNDEYIAQVQWELEAIRLKWRVTGPKKDEELKYQYFT
ncbi:MAG: hypothetical protein COT85_04070 [Chlamydiae bacterium CG10_big_fil_rev_8_21_14_0_10_42_34]|nr:MAG: hypothetical protein COT85_04070 [Chlamydiae bacterium CG10_big_fil_rev_8_21_14_0_10_42_34]